MSYPTLTAPSSAVVPFPMPGKQSVGGHSVMNKNLRGRNSRPACPAIKTASAGYHLYFHQPEGEKLGNRSGNLPKGVDCRGAGGWTVAPGAVFESWQWTGNGSKLSLAPPIPDWILSAIKERKRNEESSASRSTVGAGQREQMY